MKKAFAYVRISTGKQKGNTSIENQISVIKEYCAAHGYELVAIYSEQGSAKSIEGRPEFIKMINDLIDTNEVEYLIVLKIDRAFRKLIESLFIWDKLEENNKYFISIYDNVNTTYPHSKDTFIFNSYQAEKDRENILRNTISGMEKKATLGYFNGGKVYGYESVSKELRVIPEEASVVNFIFKKYVYDNWGYKKIASELNLQCIKTKNRKDWTTTAIKKILENKIYIGYIKWKEAFTEGLHEAIIPQELWDKAQELRLKKSFKPKKIHPGTYPLSGILKCPQCGSVMVQGNSSQKYKYYQCNKNKSSGKAACSSNLVKKEYAEEHVLNEVVSYLNILNLSPLLHQIIVSNLNSTLVSLEEKAKILKKSLDQIEKKLNHFLSLLYTEDDDGETISMDTITLFIRESEKQKKKDQKKLKDLHHRIELQKSLSLNQDIEFVVNNFETFYYLISDEDKKLLFHNFIKEIHITKGSTTKERKIKKIFYQFEPENLINILSA
ncbi:recombinase family protein [Alkalihalobacterium chitinilyticum]|uniref:Recombinase family protein n=1 Tax=Alkalihalobacterium chitinilyticum TaxID=2980103 RepID=A0ABT5VF91_9BACI|nr:recombinase family protein [Alkalihalobacterium chitinilyticum]MDE5414127.1 recombinase family protein [Alkalihalobacterium chitinilyticum]